MTLDERCDRPGPFRLTLTFLFLLAITTMTEPIKNSSSAAGPGFDRPVGPPYQGRSVVVARHGMVATSHPLAAQAGLDILRDGGNAVDAAIAANAMLGVVEPMSCGIGGDMFAIYWDSKTGQLYGLNGSGRSPLKISRSLFEQRGLSQIPIEGPLSWSVPGCVSGWQTLHDRFGSHPLDKILASSIETANHGFAVTEVIASYWDSSAEKLARWPDSASTFLVDGNRAPRFAEVFRNPQLARSYQLIAKHGADAFYKGSIAKRIVAFSEQHGGLFTNKDFRSHTSTWVEPVSTNYRGYDVWELPPNGQGIAALQILNVLEQHDVASMGPGSADYLHLFVEAKKLAFADRSRFYADPDFAELPTEILISKQYSEHQNKRIDLGKAASDVPAGDPRLKRGDTVYLTVVDKDRNCCSFIQSNYYGFGSGVTPADLGFVLQNRGALFALEDGHLNELKPGKRPFHTIIPAMVTRDGQPFFCFGVMGGDMQPQGHAQVLVNLIDFGMNVQAAGDAARVRHVGSATPTGLKAEGVGVVTVESGIDDGVIEQLQARGHEVQRSRGGFGGYQGILIDLQSGVLQGATESRKDGAAMGY